MELTLSTGKLVMGDRVTSDVVVRLRTVEGRDEWLYCHSSILADKSKYFAERLSDHWPTCQILDSRNCVEVHCEELEFDHHVTVLRFFYTMTDGSSNDMWNGVKNAIGILQVAVKLGCLRIISSCVEYLEAVPWEESDEEEILRVIPGMGSVVGPILVRLQPVNHSTLLKVFRSALQIATFPPSVTHLKTTAQEQLEYMLTEDDDAPLLSADDKIKTEVRETVNSMFLYIKGFFKSYVYDPLPVNPNFPIPVNPDFKIPINLDFDRVQRYLADLSWGCQILGRFECAKDFVYFWMEMSEDVLKLAHFPGSNLEVKSKTLEVAAKVIEAIGFGTVVLPTDKRFHMMKIWLPYARVVKGLVDRNFSSSGDISYTRVVKSLIDGTYSNPVDDNSPPTLKGDTEFWQNLESAFVSLILTLPSADQADVLSEWLNSEFIQYPDLTEAFEQWCYRSKNAKRRLSSAADNSANANGAANAVA